jgi:hypothetical protein
MAQFRLSPLLSIKPVQTSTTRDGDTGYTSFWYIGMSPPPLVVFRMG